jgi:hypothetical protein
LTSSSSVNLVKKTTLYGGNLMISKRVLFLAAALIAVSTASVMAQGALVNVDNFIVNNVIIDSNSVLNDMTYGVTTTTPYRTNTVTGQVGIYDYTLAGFNAGEWNGVGGINNSHAALDYSGNSYTTLAVMTGDDYVNGIGLSSTFHGHTVNTLTDSILQYAYYGDNNLDGVVTPDDYGLTNWAYLNGGAAGGYTGWLWGDFNMDGDTTPDDYGLQNWVYNAGGDPLGGAPYGNPIVPPTAGPVAASTVPEPCTLILLAASALCALVVSLRKR